MTQNKKKIFISYSKHDSQYKDSLLTHLSGLRDKIITWNDRDILPGEEWDERIKQELHSADVVLYLVSANSIATEYIQKDELPVIEARCKKNECIFIPIIIDFCFWEEQGFAKHNVLPEKGKSITDKQWANENEAWKKIVEGINRILKGNATSVTSQQQNYLKNYSDDIVIHAAETDLNFAETFKAVLETHLATKLGGYVFHSRLQTNAENLSSAATVISLLSPAYLQQYKDNLESLPQLKEKRLILAEINKTEKPACLAEVAEYPFWQSYKDKVLTCKDSDSLYQLSMGDLILELDALLKQLKARESVSQTAVFINVAPEDRAFAKQLQKELAQTYNVVSALPASTGTRADIENKYRYCQIIIFVYFNGSDEWLDNQLLACEAVKNECQKHYDGVDICTNKQQSDRMNVWLPYLKPHLFPPEDIQDYIRHFGSKPI